MTPDIVREKLARIYPEEGGPKFAVIFSGKKNARINGTYHPAAQDITIHDKNFASDKDGEYHAVALLYTAVHELAHHVMYTKYGSKGRGHPSLFWATFHDLLKSAEKQKIVPREYLDPSILEDVEKIQATLGAIVDKEKDLGRALSQLHIICAEQHIRFEDIIDRKFRMSRNTARKYQQMALADVEPISPDTAVLAVSSGAQGATVESQLAKGETLDQAKQSAKGIINRIEELSPEEIRERKLKILALELEKAEKSRSTIATRCLSLAAEIKTLEEAV